MHGIFEQVAEMTKEYLAKHHKPPWVPCVSLDDEEAGWAVKAWVEQGVMEADWCVRFADWELMEEGVSSEGESEGASCSDGDVRAAKDG